MDQLLNVFNINNTFFTIIGYQMSYIEFFGTILNLWSVYLFTRNNIWAWPIGNIASVLFTALFYQIQLYSDLFEQIYYIISGFYGWYIWGLIRTKKNQKELPIAHSSKSANYVSLAVIVIGTVVFGYVTSNLNIWLPNLFSQPASFAYLDAFTTIMSFTATILMAHKKIECWYLWILVDIIGIWLYFVKGVVLVSILYFIFLILATKGLFSWAGIYKTQRNFVHN